MITTDDQLAIKHARLAIFQAFQFFTPVTNLLYL